MTRDPADVGGTPVDVPGGVVEDVLMRQRREHEIAAGRVQHAFGLARRSGRVKNEQRVFSIHLLTRAVGIDLRFEIVQPNVAPLNPIDVSARVADDKDFFERFDLGIIGRRVDVGFERHRLAPATMFDSQSWMRPASASGEKPPNTTE